MLPTHEVLEYWLENAHDLFQEVAADGRILYVNRAWQETLGLTAEDARNLSLFDIIHPASRSHCETTFHDIVGGKGIDWIEAVLVAKDGRAIPVEGVCHCRYDNRQLVSIQGIFRDVSQRRQLEEQLRQAQKMEALGLLASGVSHDFGNLLMAISSTIEWMNAERGSLERIAKGLDQLGKSVESGLRLAKQLRTFSQGGVVRSVVVDLNAAVISTIEMLGRLLGSGIRIETHLDAMPSGVRMGEGQIEQIIMNLAINARDAMENRGVLSLETSNRPPQSASCSIPESPAQVVLSVRDTGCGIEEDKQQRIFEPFYTTKRTGGGCGLGLSTVFGTVQQAGGTITVESKVGEGTCFAIFLPQVEPDEVD